MFSEDISIEEDIIFYLLSTYLKNNFDASLIENIERNDTDKIEFEWNDANYYTFNAVETIINQIQNDIQKIKTNIFDNASRIESIGRYLYFYMDKDYSEDKKKIFWDNKNCVIDFYNRFISYMKKMMTVAKEKGYELILFMGP